MAIRTRPHLYGSQNVFNWFATADPNAQMATAGPKLSHIGVSPAAISANPQLAADVRRRKESGVAAEIWATGEMTWDFLQVYVSPRISRPYCAGASLNSAGPGI